MSGLVPLSKATHRLTLQTKTGNGALVAPDSLPTILNVQKNGVDADESAVTVVQMQDATPANITGSYHVVCDLSGSGLNVVANDQITIMVQATVQGTLLTMSRSFTMADLAGTLPKIEMS